MNFATAFLAGVALKPMRRRWLGGVRALTAVTSAVIPARS
jgi:hypothetical protein